MLLKILILAAVLCSPARAHEAPLGWKYPWSCCSNQDCRQVSKPTEVDERLTGYIIQGTGEIVPYGDKRLKDSPDGEFHWCAHQSGADAGHTICLFVPPSSF